MGHLIQTIATLSAIIITLLCFLSCTKNIHEIEEDREGIYYSNKVNYKNNLSPGVYHIAILEDGLSCEEKEKYTYIYKNTEFPLYCGFIVFAPNKPFTFVKKTDLPVEAATNLLRDIELSPPDGEEEIFQVLVRVLPSGKIKVVQSFDGLTGLDFVPRFKYQYPYLRRPDGLDVKNLLELENSIPSGRIKSNLRF